MRKHGASSLCPPCRQQSDARAPVAMLFHEAVQQCVRKEYGGCVAKLAEVLAAEPAHPRANILLGAMYPGLLSLSERP